MFPISTSAIQHRGGIMKKFLSAVFIVLCFSNLFAADTTKVTKFSENEVILTITSERIVNISQFIEQRKNMEMQKTQAQRMLDQANQTILNIDKLIADAEKRGVIAPKDQDTLAQ